MDKRTHELLEQLIAEVRALHVSTLRCGGGRDKPGQTIEDYTAHEVSKAARKDSQSAA